jgi:hypothetical protein
MLRRTGDVRRFMRWRRRAERNRLSSRRRGGQARFQRLGVLVLS